MKEIVRTCIGWTVDKFHLTHCRALDSKLRQGHSFFPAEEGPGDGRSSRGHTLVPPRTHQTEHGPGAVWGGGGQTSPWGNTLPSLGICEFTVHHYTYSCQNIIYNYTLWKYIAYEKFNFLFARTVFWMNLIILDHPINLYRGYIWKNSHFYSRYLKRIVIFCTYSTEINTVWEWLSIILNVITAIVYGCGDRDLIFHEMKNLFFFPTAGQNHGCLETSSEWRAARNRQNWPCQLTGQGQLPSKPSTRPTLCSTWWQNSHQGR